MTDDRVARVVAVVDAAQANHAVFRIVDEDDSDTATWYPDGLVTLRPLADILGVVPVRSALTIVVVGGRGPAGTGET